MLFASARDTPTSEEAFNSAIHASKDFWELAALYGYAHEEHVILTKDGYILTLHRIPRRKGEGIPHYSAWTARCGSVSQMKRVVVCFLCLWSKVCVEARNCMNLC